MAVTTLGRLPAFSRIGMNERKNVIKALSSPLSGYLGGRDRTTGRWVNELEAKWAEAYGVPVDAVVPCNSATSGLLAACVAAGIKPGDEVWCTPFSMSATASCAVFLGAKIRFIDIEERRFGPDPSLVDKINSNPKAIIVANIFGHPCYLAEWRKIADKKCAALIEDCAQSPFAMEKGFLCGTVGHMGVFSFNVHKHIQAGEGGLVICENEDLAKTVRGVINHGELQGRCAGLNLRMTEPTAAIVCGQLDRAAAIISDRREVAWRINEMFADVVKWVNPFKVNEGCSHAWYLWTARVPFGYIGRLVRAFHARGVPINVGYSTPLNYVFDRTQTCPVADFVNNTMISFEVCAYDMNETHFRRMREIVRDEIERLDWRPENEDRRAAN